MKKRYRSTGTLSNPEKRVFIFGAGASVYAGFPIAAGLWSFLVDHSGVDTGSMEWIDAHIASLPESDRESLTNDIERLLTDYEEGKRPRVGAFGDVSAQRPKLSRKDKEAIKSSHRHYLANPKNFDFDGYFDARVIRRASPAVSWYPISLQDFVSAVRGAFLHHHDCIKPGKGCRSFEVFERFDNCPCFPVRSFHQKNWRIREAIKRVFRAGDTVITFNWDCLLETFLWDAGLWNMTTGYGIPITIDPWLAKRLSRSQRRAIARPSPVEVLKAHGSLNWFTTPDHDEIALKFLDDLFDLPITWSFPGELYSEPLDWPFIYSAFLPPTYKKDYSDPIFDRLWVEIISAIAEADSITVAGYSLPSSDLSSRRYVTQALNENARCETINLIVPDDVLKTEWAKVADSVGKKVVKIGNRFEEWVLSATS